MLNIIIERGKVWSIKELPPKSIAIDGAVSGPFIDNDKKVYSFDHHGNCIRHATSATCIQVLDAILLGFDPTNFNLYINDIDHDTVLATALLTEPSFAKIDNVQNIVRTVGLIDAHGPAYPLQTKDKKLFDLFNHYVMEKFNQLKKYKEYGQCDLRELLFDCLENFDLMLENKYTEFKLKETEKAYTLTPPTNADWVMVKSANYVFNELYQEGYNKIVMWDLMPDGSYSYTVGKKSEFINFPIKKILETLNKEEAGWGGGSTIGGAPRNSDGSRSKLNPEKLIEIINSAI